MLMTLMFLATLPQADPRPEDPRKMLYTYLQGECTKHFDARRKEVAALKTPEDVKRRQEALRAKFVDALGGFPEKTPLNARVVGKESRDGYRFEKVIYESRPDHHVTAVLYLPEGKGPFPGVLFPCGHSDNGKAAEAYQRACILMAKNGLAVLCYDPIGQGERMQLIGANGKPLIRGTTEHTMEGIPALLVGWSCATFRIWDGIRSMDYLAGRPEVDPKRLGCTGNSGGGTLTSYLMALDDRIAVAAPSCYVTTLERLFATIGPQDAEQNITGQVAFGMEHTDYLTMRAPKPTLMCVATQDFFDITGAWTTFREAKGLFGLMGYGERVDLFEYNDKHGFSKPRREAAMRWMRRWLLGADDAPVEGDFAVMKDPELQCTPTGQVLTDLKGKSTFDLIAAREAELAGTRGKLERESLLKRVRMMIGLGSSIAPAVSRQDRLETEPGIRLAVKLQGPEPRAQVIYAHGGGASKAPAGGIQALQAEGRTVATLDLRGTGETAPDDRERVFGNDWKEAFLGVHLARPLLGQRVHDLLAAKAAIGHPGGIHAVGVGTAAPVVLHAAALDERITEVTLEGGLVSWSSVARAPMTQNMLASVVPGALQVYDFPDLAATLAPRKLTIKAPVDAAGKPVSQADLEAAYARTIQAYKAAGAEKKLVLKAAP